MIEHPGRGDERKIQKERLHQGQLRIGRPANAAEYHEGNGADGFDEVRSQLTAHLAQIAEHLLPRGRWDRDADQPLEPRRRRHQPVSLPQFLPQFLTHSLPQTAVTESMTRVAVAADSSSARSPTASRR